MQNIHIYIDKQTIRVEDDKVTYYRLSNFYMENLQKTGTLSPDDLKGFGFEIFNSIFSTKKSRERIHKLLDELKNDDNLTFTISSEFEDVHNIPFEILNRDGTDKGFLLKKGNIAIVRNIPSLDKKVEPLTAPIKILILLSLPLQVYKESPIDPLKELDVVYKALDHYIKTGVVEVDVEEKVSIPVLREKMLKQNYHVIHFIGHGAKGGKLVIEDEKDNKAAKEIGAEELRDIFKNSNVRLFYFDACETGSSTVLEPSLAYHIYKGIPLTGVIANLVRVRDDLATETTKHIYRSIFESRHTANALNLSHLKMVEDWWKPVLFIKPNENLFEIGTTEKREEKKRVIQRELETAKNYVYRYGVVREASEKIEEANYLVIHGIGGAGKSTLANYLSKFYDGKFTHILFFDLKEREITEPEKLMDEIIGLLKREGLIEISEYQKIRESGSDIEPKERVFDKWNFIKKILVDKTLLILDNLEGTIQEPDGLIKKEWRDLLSDLLNIQSIFTIFTSRLKPRLSARKELEHVLEIGEYTEAEVDFLFRDLKEPDKKYADEKIDEITKHCGSHPLSLGMAVNKKFDNIKKMFELKEFHDVFDFYRKYFEEYREETEKLFLLKMPFSAKFMEKFFSADFISLIKNSLLILKEENNHFSLYRVLVSYYQSEFGIKDKALKTFKEEIVKELQSPNFSATDFCNIFSILFSCYKKKKDEKIEENLIDVFFSLPDEYAKRIVEPFTKEVEYFSVSGETAGITYNKIGLVYMAKGEYEQALNFHNKALKTMEEVLGEEHQDTAVTYNNIAMVYQDKGEYETALMFHNKALKIREEVLGKDHLDTAGTYNNIAMVYKKKGKYEPALNFYNKALKIREEVLGKEHLDNAKTYNNIALVYQDKGEYELSLTFHNKALKIWEEVLGKEHLDTALTYNNIAMVYQAIGEFELALMSLNKALKIREEALGKNHPSTAVTYNNIAMVYQDKGEYELALNFYNKALKIFENRLVKDHPDTANTYNNIAMLYQAKGEFDLALSFYKKALKIWKNKLGKEHPINASAYNGIASVYQEKGEFVLALSFYKKALKILGKDHPNTANIYNNIAMLYQAKGEYDQALNFFNKALKIVEHTLGKNHPKTAHTYNNIASVCRVRGEFDQASTFYHKGLQSFQARKDYNNMMMTYPGLIDCAVKSKKTDINKLAGHIGSFLELFEIFKDKDRSALNCVITFIKEKTFEQIPLEKIRSLMQNPVDQQRLDNFLEFIKALSADESKEDGKDSV